MVTRHVFAPQYRKNVKIGSFVVFVKKIEIPMITIIIIIHHDGVVCEEWMTSPELLMMTSMVILSVCAGRGVASESAFRD